MTGEMQDDKHQDEDQGDDPEHVHPAWCALFAFHNGYSLRDSASTLNQCGCRLADDQCITRTFQPFRVRLSTINSAPTLSIARPLKLPLAVDVETSHATFSSHVYEIEVLFWFTALANSMSSER